MKDNVYIGHIPHVKAPEKIRKPGRPRAIPQKLEPAVQDLHQLGHVYRAISRILTKDYHTNPDFSTVKRTLIRMRILPHHGFPTKLTPD